MMILLQTNVLSDWMEAVSTLVEAGGLWTVATAVYSDVTSFAGSRIGCRAAAWLPLGRELVVFDHHRDTIRGTADDAAAERDFEDMARRVCDF
jgi:hypothetical protein